MASLDSGKMTLTLRPVSLFHSVKDCISNFDGMINEKNISVSFNLEKEKDIKIFADISSLVQTVLGNIMSNAIKFVEQNGLINIEIFEIQKNRVKLIFQDNGIGIPKTLGDKIFCENEKTTRLGTKRRKGNRIWYATS